MYGMDGCIFNTLAVLTHSNLNLLEISSDCNFLCVIGSCLSSVLKLRKPMYLLFINKQMDVAKVNTISISSLLSFVWASFSRQGLG